MKTNLRQNLIQTCLLAALLALPAVVQAQFNYTTNNGTITITGYTGSGGAVSIPATINGLPVTSIGDYTFYGTALTNVTIPESVTSIGDYAFAYTALTSMTIPDSVTNIGEFAFHCSSLTNIIVAVDNPVYSSANGVLFDKNQTTLVEFPEGYVGNYIIPNTVTSIGDWAFADCASLTNIVMGNSVTSIGASALSGLSIFAVVRGDPLTSIIILNSVTNIASRAFDGCNSLTNAVILGGVIGEGAFADCYHLTNVVLGTNVTSIGNFAFSAPVVYEGYFDGDPLTSIIIPKSVTNIGYAAFDGCTSLTNVIIFGGVIGPREFYSCYNLASVFIGTSVTNIRVWLPLIQIGDASFGVRTNQFGFNIAWASGQTVVVEACTNLHNPVWSSIATNTLAGDSSYFSDPQSLNYPARFYRLRSP